MDLLGVDSIAVAVGLLQKKYRSILQFNEAYVLPYRLVTYYATCNAVRIILAEPGDYREGYDA